MTRPIDAAHNAQTERSAVLFQENLIDGLSRSSSIPRVAADLGQTTTSRFAHQLESFNETIKTVFVLVDQVLLLGDSHQIVVVEHGESNVLQNGPQVLASRRRVVMKPDHDRIVDLAFVGHRQLVARQYLHNIITIENEEIFTATRLNEVVLDCGKGG